MMARGTIEAKASDSLAGSSVAPASSMSTNNGTAPQANTALVPYMAAFAATATRSPAVTPSALSASSSASVPLATPMHSEAPQ